MISCLLLKEEDCGFLASTAVEDVEALEEDICLMSSLLVELARELLPPVSSLFASREALMADVRS